MKATIKIGVTYTGDEEKHNNYVNWLKGSDDISIVRLSVQDNNPDIVKDLNGIVLSGGLDVHPGFYNNTIIDYPNRPALFDERRDEFEIAIFKLSQQQQLPVLGVCRGMQLVNCILGGSLSQDIGEVGNTLHRFEQRDKVHGIKILPGTLLEEITHLHTATTNSAHHQAISIAGEGLKINAFSEDGIIEGVEWTYPEGKPFFLGIQWHPERMNKSGLGESPATKNIRDRFIKECVDKVV